MHETIAHAERTLSTQLSAKRWRHIQGVRDTVARLARQHGFSVEKGELAALLHDCAKETAIPTLDDLFERGALHVDGFTLKTPGLHHTAVGCHVAREIFGVEDAEVLEAIRYHSTGAPGLGTVAQLVYVSDWIEPGRSFVDTEGLLALGMKDFDRLVDRVATEKLSHGIERGRPMHPNTLHFLNERIACRRAAEAA